MQVGVGQVGAGEEAPAFAIIPDASTNPSARYGTIGPRVVRFRTCPLSLKKSKV